MDGKIFNRSASSVAITNFDFDLQRFTVTDNKWQAGTTLFNGQTLTADEINGYAEQGDHAIKVVNGSTTKYFDYMQSAMNYVLGNKVAPTGSETNNAYGNYLSEDAGATVTLLKDITSGDAFTIGRTRASDAGVATKVTIDLDGHSYLFANVLTSANATSISKVKAISTSYNDNTAITIKNGTLGISGTATSQMERLIRSYVDLTLDGVTIDGSNFPVGSNGLEKGFDGAIICHTAGDLNITGSTNITAPEGYYAVSGKLSTKKDNYKNGFNIAINTTGTISNVSMYEWGTNDQWDTSSGSFAGNSAQSIGGGTLSIGGGTIGELMYSEKAVNAGAMSTTTINGGAVVNSITYGSSANSLAYAESTDSVSYDTRSAGSSITSGGNGKIFIFGQTGWNPDSTTEKKFNFVAESVASGDVTASLKAGQIIIAAAGATATSSFEYDSVNSVFGLPTNITATWGPGLGDTLKANYAVAKMNYDGSAKEAVTISSVSLGSGSAGSVKFVAKNSSTEGGLFAATTKKIDASALSIAASIVGNSLDNTIYGGKGDDSLTGGVGTATSLRGSNTFYYSAGKDVITDFNRTTDKIVITTDNFAPAASQIQSLESGFNISLSADNQLKLNDVSNLGTTNVLPTNGVKVAAERNGREIANYVYTAYSVADMTGDKANGVTLAPNYVAYKLAADGKTYTNETLGAFTADNPFVTINASATSLSGGLDITGFTNANYILAGQNGGSLNGNGGDDTLRGGSGADVFIYSAGKNVIEEYDKDKDVVDMNATNITSATSNRKGLVFSTNSSSDILTFKPIGDAETAVEKVSLNGGGFLTKDGAVSSSKKFDLFADSKGAIDLNDTIYSSASINAVNAADVTNSVTLTGSKHVRELTFGANNKKDVFVYGGGSITISGYEDGTDKLNIYDTGAISAFSVNGSSGDIDITVGSANNVISLKSAKDKEVLIHDENSRGNSFDKFVFHDTGVLYNKEKPTEAMIYSNATGFSDKPSTLKKIFALENVKGIKIASSDNKMTLDASAAGASVDGSGIVGVSLEGGVKSNKFIASGGRDMFIYKGGKDVIEDFGVASGNADSISFGDSTAFSVESAKITLSKKSIKFKFDSKNTLTLKNSDSIGGTFQIGDNSYSYAKNSIVDGNQVSLTSQFSGSYKLEDGINNVDGHLVQKNLTFKGTSAQETLIGGQKKTTFKGGGGADNLVGGSGKDVFFYAKGDSGTSTIANFDFEKDRIKIANGTINKIESLSGGGIQFAMTSGKKGNTSPIGWFKVTSDKDNEPLGDKNVAIKANSTIYWFATEEDKDKYVSASTGDAISVGDLITFENKVSKSQVRDGYEILDLSYSTNLAKSTVAIKVTERPTSNNKD